MNLQRILAIALRQLFLFRGSFTRVLPLFAWSSLDIAVWGFTTQYLGTVAMPGVHLGATLLGAVVLWNFLTRVMHGVTTTFLEDVWSRNFLNLFSTPLTVPEYLAGLVLTSISISAVGLGAMLTVAVQFFGLLPAQAGWVTLPCLFILLCTGLALGIVACAMVLRFGPSAEWLVWPLPMLLTPFAGVFYPQSVLPPWMQTVARGIAPAYVFEGLRGAAQGGAAPVQGLAVGLSLALGYIAVAYGLFVLTYKYAVRTGLIARYSAESVV
ncbi:MAG: ABC transporter permease [Deltaproteobacteria bacterium]|nr:MAG: ABC transporter permease [Deltaproteobacteria bacterium]